MLEQGRVAGDHTENFFEVLLSNLLVVELLVIVVGHGAKDAAQAGWCIMALSSEMQTTRRDLG